MLVLPKLHSALVALRLASLHATDQRLAAAWLCPVLCPPAGWSNGLKTTWLPLLHPGIVALCLAASTQWRLLCCVLLQVRSQGLPSDWGVARLRLQDLWPAAGQSSRQALELRKACQLNTSMCLLQLQRLGEVVPECNAVINVEPQNSKALYRRGQALHALGRCRANPCPACLAWPGKCCICPTQCCCSAAAV